MGIISYITFDTLRLRAVDIARQLNATPAAVSKLAAKRRADPSTEGIEKILYEKQGVFRQQSPPEFWKPVLRGISCGTR
jgi:hypothetical protein